MVNEEMMIPLPEGFHVNDDEEKRALAKGQKAPAWVMSDPDRHIVFSVSWKGDSKLASVLVSAKDMAKMMRKKFGQAAADAGYTFGELRKFNVGGAKACGYPFSYVVDDVAMCGDSAVVKKGKNFYFFHTYYREALKEEDEAILEEIYNGIDFQ